MIVQSPTINLTVVVPAHNEAQNLPTLVAEIVAGTPSDVSLEVLVIDDGSSDETPQLLQTLAVQYPNLVSHRLDRQSGQSTALSVGFDLARGEVVATIDADLQNDAADIPKLLKELEQADLAVGWRHQRKDTLSKRVISKCANFIRRKVTGDNIRDTGCGLKAFKRHCLTRLHRFDGMHRFFPVLVQMQGLKVAEVPVNHRPRKHGRTHYNIFNRSIRPIMDLLAVSWLQKRTLRYRLEREHALVQY